MATFVVKKFPTEADLQTFLTASPSITIDAVFEKRGIVLVYH